MDVVSFIYGMVTAVVVIGMVLAVYSVTRQRKAQAEKQNKESVLQQSAQKMIWHCLEQKLDDKGPESSLDSLNLLTGTLQWTAIWLAEDHQVKVQITLERSFSGLYLGAVIRKTQEGVQDGRQLGSWITDDFGTLTNKLAPLVDVPVP